MQKTKKQFFGALGLALVAGMTTFAHFLPTPNAFAHQVNLQVEVKGGGASTTILPPTATTNDSNHRIVTFKIRHIRVRHAEYKLTGPGGAIVPLSRDTFDTTLDDVEDVVTAVLPADNHGQYVFSVKATKDNATFVEDAASYDYQPATVSPAPTPTPDSSIKPIGPNVDPVDPNYNGTDPRFQLSYGSDICKIETQAYTIPGSNPVLNPVHTYIVPNPVPSDRRVVITLPFAAANIAKGKYKIVSDYYKRDAAGRCNTKTGNPVFIDNYEHTGNPVKPSEVDPSSGDPAFRIEYDAKVCKIEFQAYQLPGNRPLFNPVQEFIVPTPVPANRVANVTLKFASFGAKTGNYKIVATSFTRNNAGQCTVKNPSPTIINNFSYRNPSIDAPNTGHKLLGLDLHSSESTTAFVVAFSVVSMIGLSIVIRKKNA